ncbi:MAG: dienelactone hydrolase family protein [Proteobacteria bacterium]|nr:dienelactone hydrolase family protein [Pseudomonadota bacterium]
MSIFNTVVTEENGKKLKAYVAAPQSKDGKGHGVILMHEVYGVTEGLTHIADKLAGQGFLVACPNMYWEHDEDASFKYDPTPEILAAMPEDERKSFKEQLANDRNTARDLMFRFTNTQSAEEVAASNAKIISYINKVSAFLRGHPNGTGKVAASGFCFGGRNTYIALANDADVDAGVAMYATPELHKVFNRDAAMNIDAPLLFIVGGEDPYINDNEKEDMIVASARHTVTYVSGRKKPIVEKNQNGNSQIIALYYANSNHGWNRIKSVYSDPGTSEHTIGVVSEFLKSALGGRGYPSVPMSALLTTPRSPTYHPQHKV